MYCVKCGVHLADTEKKCPLCSTVVYHPEIKRESKPPLYPSGKMPKSKSGRAFICGAIIIVFMIPLIITFLSDMQLDGKLDWFGYAAGGIVLAYLTFALPMWFKNPNPVIFVPCDIAACAGYLLYIDIMTDGNWFMSFAFPIIIGASVIVCTLVTLLRYLRKGKLYVIGGSVMVLGALIFFVEMLIVTRFDLQFAGWSLYPLISLFLVGGLLIYLAMNSVAREKIERKIFF